MSHLLVYLAMIPGIVVLDLLWLGIIMKDFYRANLGHLMASSISWAPAIVFYLVFAFGLLYFAVLPNAAQGLVRTMLVGALFGAIAYATYDLTNHATLKDWPLAVTLVDIAWGAFLSALVAGLGYFVLTR